MSGGLPHERLVGEGVRVLVGASHCWVAPEGLDLKKAACIPAAFGTAYEALFEFGKLQPAQPRAPPRLSSTL